MTAELEATLSRLRRIEAAAIAAADAADAYDAMPCSVTLLREREAMKALKRALTEE